MVDKIKKNKYLGPSFKEELNKRLKEDLEFALLYKEERFKSSLSKNMVKLREGAGLTQKQLAKKVKTTQSAISRLESPQNSRMPSLDLLNRVARAVNMNLIISFEKGTNNYI